MKEDFARGKCPICGRPTKFRKNKNGILYTYCDYGHHAKLGRDDSTEAAAAINAGQSWNNGVSYLYPLTKGKENDERQGNFRQTTGTDDRADIGRWTGGNNNAVSGTIDDRTDDSDDDTETIGFF